MGRLIVITDAHVGRARAGTAEFFQMLARIEDVAGDLVFLGDVFDLWIALARYENELHRRFLAWCRRQKRLRSIGFMEGNHEFFVAQERASAFSWCTESPCRQEGGLLFVHGDQIDRGDLNHRFFRRLTRNRLAKTILRLVPGGPRLAGGIAARLRISNRRLRAGLPVQAIRRFGEARLGGAVHTVLVGHFHHEQRLGGGAGGQLVLLPDWHGSKRITLFDADRRAADTRHWRQLR
jgi:UDP-2,3-diacylglucosamine pyrophosphatase LpxH